MNIDYLVCKKIPKDKAIIAINVTSKKKIYTIYYFGGCENHCLSIITISVTIYCWLTLLCVGLFIYRCSISVGAKKCQKLPDTRNVCKLAPIDVKWPHKKNGISESEYIEKSLQVSQFYNIFYRIQMNLILGAQSPIFICVHNVSFPTRPHIQS